MRWRWAGKKDRSLQKSQGRERDRLRVKAFDELGTAIFTQVEVAYNLVRLSEIDFGVVSKQPLILKKTSNSGNAGVCLPMRKSACSTTG